METNQPDTHEAVDGKSSTLSIPGWTQGDDDGWGRRVALLLDNPKLPRHTRERIEQTAIASMDADGTFPRILANAVAGCTLTSPSCLARLSIENRAFLKRSNPENIATSMAYEAIAASIAQNESTPGEVLVAHAASARPHIHIAVAGNPSAPEIALRMLGMDMSVYTRRAVAGNPSTPVDLLLELTEDENILVRRAVAENRKSGLLSYIPHGIVGTLARDPSPDVRSALACNPETHPHALRMLAQDPNPNVRACVASSFGKAEGHLEDERLPEMFARMEHDLAPLVRKAFASNPLAASDALERLSRDDDEKVRAEVARNASTPAAALKTLASDPRASVRKNAALNPSTPVDSLRLLAGDTVGEVRLAVALNAQTPGDALMALSEDDEPGVRRFLAMSYIHCKAEPAAFEAVLRKLARDEDERVRESAIRNSAMPRREVAELAAKGNPIARGEMAARCIDPDRLRKYASDSHPYVRECVAHNFLTPPDELMRLLRKSDDPIIWKAILGSDITESAASPETLSLAASELGFTK